ncbi:hypothetical protein ACFQ0B_00830 [Nonomuraea thailandensis]
MASRSRRTSGDGPSGPSAIFSLPAHFIPAWQCSATTPGSGPSASRGLSRYARVRGPNPTDHDSSSPCRSPSVQVRSTRTPAASRSMTPMASRAATRSSGPGSTG